MLTKVNAIQSTPFGNYIIESNHFGIVIMYW